MIEILLLLPTFIHIFCLFETPPDFVTNHKPIPPMCPHAKICTDNPVSDRVKTDRVITNEEMMNYVCAMKV